MSRSAAVRVADTVTEITQPEPVSVAAAAAEALQQTDTVLHAAALLERRASNDAELRAALLDPYLAQACYNAVAIECRRNRQKVWTAPNYDKGGKGERVMEHARSLLDFPLPGGLRLRDATQKEVTAAAEFFAKQANDMSRKGRWLGAIAEKLTGRKKVASVFDESALAQLRDATK